MYHSVDTYPLLRSGFAISVPSLPTDLSESSSIHDGGLVDGIEIQVDAVIYTVIVGG